MAVSAREFRGRALLKGIILAADLATLGLAGFIGAASVLREDFFHLAFLALPLLALLAVLVRLTNRTFSVLRIDGDGVVVSRLVGATRIPWTAVGTVFHWIEHQQSPHGGGAAEPFAALVGTDSRRLLLLKSTYPPESFPALLDFARSAGVRVELRKP